MSFKEPKWGFWIAVKDYESAAYAAKMSGLPVFLLGISFLFTGIIKIAAGLPISASLYWGAMGIAGMFFIFSGLQIRKQKFQTLPLSVALWLLLTAIGLVISMRAGGVSNLVNLLISLLTISGLRGWWWLRENPHHAPEQFD